MVDMLAGVMLIICLMAALSPESFGRMLAKIRKGYDREISS